MFAGARSTTGSSDVYAQCADGSRQGNSRGLLLDHQPLLGYPFHGGPKLAAGALEPVGDQFRAETVGQTRLAVLQARANELQPPVRGWTPDRGYADRLW